eukprot:4058960-Pyramimonas_sp.AAC.1
MQALSLICIVAQFVGHMKFQRRLGIVRDSIQVRPPPALMVSSRTVRRRLEQARYGTVPGRQT